MSRLTCEKLRNDGVEEVWKQYEGDVLQISMSYNLCQSTVYAVLRKYCIKKHLEYKSFLRYPQKSHKRHVYKVVSKKKPDNPHKRRKIRKVTKFLPQKIQIDTDIDFVIELLKSLNANDAEDICEAADLLITIIEQKGEK